jgi:hypothetical protein
VSEACTARSSAPFAFVELTEVFQSMTRHWQLLLGGAIIVLVIFVPAAWRASPDAFGALRGELDDE